jgi:hypothetical protein
LGAPDYEPPIRVFMVLHIDPKMNEEKTEVVVTPEIYQTTRDQLTYLKEESESHGMRFTALYNGWYVQEALERGDTDQFRQLIDAGHEIGTHAHRLTYDADRDVWVSHVEELSKVPPITYDHELARETWNDAYRYVDAMLTEIGAQGENETVCAVAFQLSDQQQLMDEFGFSIAAGQQGESSIGYFGHIIWNPWRPTSSDDPGLALTEDLNTRFMAVPHLAQIGIRGGVHDMDLSLEQLQRRFLMLYTEWLGRERTGADDKVWSFGFVYHPEDGDIFNDTFEAFLDWLDEGFIGGGSPHGNVIAEYATVGEIADAFYAWEAANPGVSSFSYARDDPYPYTYPALATMLDDAAYEGEVDAGPETAGYRFTKEGQQIYMLWSLSGTQTIDLSGELSGPVLATSAYGDVATADASSLTVTEDPLFVTAG